MRPGRGILLMILAVTLFTAMSACIKAADRVPAGQAVFFRAGLTVPVVLLWLALSGRLVEGLRTAQPWVACAPRHRGVGRRWGWASPGCATCRCRRSRRSSSSRPS
jgi:drug/metabolite transporter (DMT)-like permease